MHIESLCIAHCSHALLTFLPSSDGAQRSTEDYDVVFRILTGTLIPTAHTLVHDEAFECKVVSARLALNMLHMPGKETGNAITSLVEGWYHGHDQWRAAFEAAIQTMVSTVLFAYLQSSIMFSQVKDDDWQAVVTILKALMEQLPNELRFPTATKFLPALNEVRHTQRQCFLVLRIHFRNSLSTHLRFLSQHSQNF